MALISMAVYDTPDNKRFDLTRRTLESLWSTVDFDRHRLVLVDNGSTDPRTQGLFDRVRPNRPVGFDVSPAVGVVAPPAVVIRNAENRGTARAVNQGWLLRRPDECAVKADNDIVIRQDDWLDLLEECVARDQRLGIVGLKRKDLEERPDHDALWYRSELTMLPHQRGERWLAVERCQHVMGTCQLYSPALLGKIGFLYQRGLYGFDDSDAGVRCHVAGFYSAFLVGVELDHIDPGGNDFTAWKQGYAGERIADYQRTCREYASGERSIYRGPDED